MCDSVILRTFQCLVFSQKLVTLRSLDTAQMLLHIIACAEIIIYTDTVRADLNACTNVITQTHLCI